MCPYKELDLPKISLEQIFELTNLRRQIAILIGGRRSHLDFLKRVSTRQQRFGNIMGTLSDLCINFFTVQCLKFTLHNLPRHLNAPIHSLLLAYLWNIINGMGQMVTNIDLYNFPFKRSQVHWRRVAQDQGINLYSCQPDLIPNTNFSLVG